MARLKYKMRLVVCVVLGMVCLLYRYVSRVNPDRINNMRMATPQSLCGSSSDQKPSLPVYKGRFYHTSFTYIIINYKEIKM